LGVSRSLEDESTERGSTSHLAKYPNPDYLGPALLQVTGGESSSCPALGTTLRCPAAIKQFLIDEIFVFSPISSPPGALLQRPAHSLFLSPFSFVIPFLRGTMDQQRLAALLQQTQVRT
jgi:hypothetical protein